MKETGKEKVKQFFSTFFLSKTPNCSLNYCCLVSTTNSLSRCCCRMTNSSGSIHNLKNLLTHVQRSHVADTNVLLKTRLCLAIIRNDALASAQCWLTIAKAAFGIILRIKFKKNTKSTRYFIFPVQIIPAYSPIRTGAQMQGCFSSLVVLDDPNWRTP